MVIIGAGPTGLGAAWRLHELGHDQWTVFEAAEGAGGLASSIVDERGFTWDLGGHVLFSHYKYFDRLMDLALGDDWLTHEREAGVWMRERWLPYPLQNNIWRLPKDELSACLDGLVSIHGRAPGGPKPRSFREWLLAGFGAGLCDTFMFPYNRKVWAYDPDTMDVGWMGERVATVDLARVLRNVVHERDDVGWGPNSTFRFPKYGGTGRIWQSVAGRLPQDRLRFGHAVQSVDPAPKVVTFTNGTTAPYDRLISTMPLDRLLLGLHGRPDLAARAPEFVHSSSHIVGVGLNGQPPASLTTKCWMYFPEDRVPFYRATVFSNYSPHNVPDASRQWSLMAEVSESPVKPVDATRIVDEVVQGFVDCGFIAAGDVASVWHRRLEHGYPTPWLGRDDVLHPIDAALRGLDIYSRGRFGAWKYEVSNQDHSLMQGVEVVDLLLGGTAERTYHGDMSDR
ncbi:MAG: FAD-dependent oxidoreductase [Acidobacteria bacterium]|nr:FAD-dependent oxidoreductase [Acidobacteriota bacterium]